MADFDQTCNKRDTSELYYRATQKYRNASQEEQKLLDEKWQKVTGKYLREYRAQISSSLAKFDKITSSVFDEVRLHAFLNEIAAFNQAATKDVDESNLIVGADKPGLQWAARQVLFYPGCIDVLKSILSHVRIVSVNWSSEMIGFAFNEMIPSQCIFANKLLDSNGLSSGLVGKQFISSFDKRVILKNIMEAEKCQDKLTVFVGDSITDLLSMLEVDIGIIIGDSITLLRVAKIFGVNVLPLSDILHQSELMEKCRNTKTKTLYVAQDWYQIEKLLNNFSF